MEDIALHDVAEDCWYVLYGVLYDLTDYAIPMCELFQPFVLHRFVLLLEGRSMAMGGGALSSKRVVTGGGTFWVLLLL